MKPILLNECSSEVTDLLTGLLGGEADFMNGTFEENKSLDDYRMVVMEPGIDQKEALAQISKTRYSCNFRNIPIIVMRGKGNFFPIRHYILAGATEVLSMNDPPAACRQILKGHLIPDRNPLKEEMEYLQPFIESTIHVLKKMTSETAEFREMYFSNTFRIFGDISGIIGLSGEAEGTVVLTFYWDLACKIIAQMMQVQDNAINAELIHDGVGELINMIGGFTKKGFVGTHYHFDLSLPTVVVGSGHQIGHPEGASIAILIFEMNGRAFALHVCLKPKKRG